MDELNNQGKPIVPQPDLPQNNPSSFGPMLKHSFKMQLAFVVSFIILVGVIGGSVFAYFKIRESNKKEEPSNEYEGWEDCSGENDLDISMKIPADWTCENSQEGVENGLGGGTTWDILDITSPDKVNISFNRDIVTPTHCGCEESINEAACIESGGHVCTEEEFLKGDNYTFDALVYMDNDIKKSDWIYADEQSVSRFGAAVWIHKEGDLLPTTEEKEIISKIMNSITVPDQKTYSSSVFKGLEVKYPSDWTVEEDTRYGIKGFSFKLTNGVISWKFEVESGGILEPSPTLQDLPLDWWCVGAVYVFPVMENDENAFSKVENTIQCDNNQQVIWYTVNNPESKTEFTEEEYEVLNKITNTFKRESSVSRNWQEVELINMGLVLEIPEGWTATEVEDLNKLPSEQTSNYIATISDGTNKYEIYTRDWFTGINDRGICEMGNRDETVLFDMSVLDQNVDMITYLCLGAPEPVGDGVVGRYSTLTLNNIAGAKYSYLKFVSPLEDKTISIDDLKAKYTDIKAVLESIRLKSGS